MSILAILVVIVIISSQCLRFIKNDQLAIVLRSGKFFKVVEPGIFWTIPFIDKTCMVDLIKNTIGCTSPAYLTRDNYYVVISTIVKFRLIQKEHLKELVEAIFDSLNIYMRSAITGMACAEVLKSAVQFENELNKNEISPQMIFKITNIKRVVNTES